MTTSISYCNLVGSELKILKGLFGFGGSGDSCIVGSGMGETVDGIPTLNH